MSQDYCGLGFFSREREVIKNFIKLNEILYNFMKNDKIQWDFIEFGGVL